MVVRLRRRLVPLGRSSVRARGGPLGVRRPGDVPVSSVWSALRVANADRRAVEAGGVAGQHPSPPSAYPAWVWALLNDTRNSGKNRQHDA